MLAEESCGGGGSAPVAVKLMPRAKAASPALQREMLTQRSCLMHPHVIQVRCMLVDDGASKKPAVDRAWLPSCMQVERLHILHSYCLGHMGGRI